MFFGSVGPRCAARGRLPQTVRLYPHQVEAVEFLTSNRRALLADEMGLGKTISAIAAFAKLEARNVLVVCPSVVAWNWKHELREFAPQYDVSVVTSTKAIPDVPFSTRRVIVITSTLLPSLAKALMHDKLIDGRFDALVVDEAHQFKTVETKRTDALYFGRSGVPPVLEYVDGPVWLLTGTPAPNTVLELYPHLRALWSERIKSASFEQFASAFTVRTPVRVRGRVVGARVVAHRRLDVFRKMMSDVMLRRKADEVLDLPPIRFESIHVRPTRIADDDAMRIVEAMKPAAATIFRQHADDPEAAVRELSQVQGLAEWRHACGAIKSACLGELLAAEMHDNPRPIVVFAYHRRVIEALVSALSEFDVSVIDGSTPAAKRTEIVSRFQATPPDGGRVIVCQLNAAGVGITLTAAAEVVFAEASFVPAENAQAARRCYRIGQTRPVRIRFAVLSDSVDEPLMRVLRRKTELLAEVL
jgi:SWI/SNF-related matrix-associated actin-dependent regulator 1 of chromatin subfamily A